jgi:hypothetical protein
MNMFEGRLEGNKISIREKYESLCTASRTGSILGGRVIRSPHVGEEILKPLGTWDVLIYY